MRSRSLKKRLLSAQEHRTHSKLVFLGQADDGVVSGWLNVVPFSFLVAGGRFVF